LKCVRYTFDIRKKSISIFYIKNIKNLITKNLLWDIYGIYVKNDHYLIFKLNTKTTLLGLSNLIYTILEDGGPSGNLASGRQLDPGGNSRGASPSSILGILKHNGFCVDLRAAFFLLVSGNEG